MPMCVQLLDHSRPFWGLGTAEQLRETRNLQAIATISKELCAACKRR